MTAPSAPTRPGLAAGDPVVWARLVYERLGLQARRPCDLCRPSMPCELAQRVALLADAASIALDMAMAAESDERIRASVAW